MISKKWSIESTRKQHFGVEVDIIARNPKGMRFIVEVKSEGALTFGVSRKQLQRLERVALGLSAKEPIGLMILVVDEASRVTPLTSTIV